MLQFLSLIKHHSLVPVENHSLLELADENYHLSLDLVRSSENVPTLHNSLSRSLTAGEQLATRVNSIVCVCSDYVVPVVTRC